MTTTHSRYESLPKKPGIARVHMRACAHLAGKRCNCTPSYRAEVFDKTTGKRERRTHSSEEAAKRWRIDKQAALQDGRHRVGARMTVAEAWAAFDSGLEAGTVKAAGGKDYKPGVLQAKNYLLPRLGRMQLAEVRRVHVQQLVDDLVIEAPPLGRSRTPSRRCACCSSGR